MNNDNDKTQINKTNGLPIGLSYIPNWALLVLMSLSKIWTDDMNIDNDLIHLTDQNKWVSFDYK